MKRDVWVDFNDLDSQGRMTAFIERVESDVTIAKGAQVVVGDGEGSHALARVVTNVTTTPSGRSFDLVVDLATIQSE